MTFRAPDPPLRDGPVTLRPWGEDDAHTLVRRISDPDVVEFLDRVPHPYRLADALEYIAASREGWSTGESTNFAIRVDGSDGPIGSIGVRWAERADGIAEVGYWVAAEARGRGVATAATRLVARWAFDVAPDLERLQLRADVLNGASNRVAEKAGFTREGVLRSSRFNERLNRRIDFVMWSLVRSE